MLQAIGKQQRIISALILREMSTRFGREGLGFAWVVLEPLAFCVGVLILWTATKPAYEHGLRIAPFMMTGYMSLILMRHQITTSSSAIQANIGLLHHRQIKPLHLFLARNLLEFLGTTAAFFIVYIALMALGQVSLPHDYFLMFSGWLLLGWVGMGFALVVTGIALRFDFLERIIGLLTYVLVPLSGAFFMVDWLPAHIRDVYLLLPFPHPIEMLRAGVFGEFVQTHYDPVYAFAWGTVFNISGLLLIASGRDKVDVE